MNVDPTIKEPVKQSMVQFKGIKDGLLITLPDEDWENQKKELLGQLNQKAGFFKGAKVTLEVGSQKILAAEMGELRDKLSECGVTLWAVISNSPVTDRTSQMLGLATKLASIKTERSAVPTPKKRDGESAILMQRTLRSGAAIHYTGHITVVGDVNPGAEVEATGSVIVWGKLRGVVHAGIEGNKEAVICALDFNPLAVEIAGISCTLPVHDKNSSQPSIACLKDDSLHINHWKP